MEARQKENIVAKLKVVERTKLIFWREIVYLLDDLDEFEKEAASKRGFESLITKGTTSKAEIDRALDGIAFTAKYLRGEAEKKNKPQA